MYIRSYCFTRSSGLQKYLQSWKLIVQNQLFREHGLMNKFSSTGKITDVFRAMTVTGRAAAADDICGSSGESHNSFLWYHHGSHMEPGKLRYFKDCSGFSGSSGKNIIIYR